MTLYSDLKMFHFTDTIDSLPENMPVKAPVHIRLKPTNICNHKCKYCAYRDDNTALGKDMRLTDSIPHAKMVEICADIVSMGVQAVTFSGGGEPLVYPHLLEAAQILHQGGVKLASLTNGARLDGAIAEFFAHSATWIRVSMDGWDNASYSYYRSVPDGEYDKILENLENFVKQGGPCVLGVSYIIDAHNAAHIVPMLSRLKDAGVRSVKLSACVVSDDPKVNTAYHDPHFAQVSEQIAKAKILFSCDTFEIQDSFHNLDKLFTKNYTWCPTLQLNPVIGADSHVYSCHDKAYDMATGFLGSLSKISFKEFWMRDKEKFFAINPSVVCNNHCVANHKNMMLHEYLQHSSEHIPFI